MPKQLRSFCRCSFLKYTCCLLLHLLRSILLHVSLTMVKAASGDWISQSITTLARCELMLEHHPPSSWMSIWWNSKVSSGILFLGTVLSRERVGSVCQNFALPRVLR